MSQDNSNTTGQSEVRVMIDALKRQHPWPANEPDAPEDWHGWLNCDTHAMLYRHLTASTKLVVECGSWLGMSTRAILFGAPSTTIICCDHWKGSPEQQSDPDCARRLPPRSTRPSFATSGPGTTALHSLSAQAQRSLNGVPRWISAISCWELAKLVELRRLGFTISTLSWIRRSLNENHIRIAALTPEIAGWNRRPEGISPGPCRPDHCGHFPGVGGDASVDRGSENYPVRRRGNHLLAAQAWPDRPSKLKSPVREDRAFFLRRFVVEWKYRRSSKPRSTAMKAGPILNFTNFHSGRISYEYEDP